MISLRKSAAAYGVAALLALTTFAAGSDTRLADAEKNKDLDTVRSLLKQRVDVNTPQPDGATALAWAAHWDDLEIADLLIQAGANTNAANDYGVTPLQLACTNRSAAMVEKLLKAGANPNAASSIGETALMVCAGTGNPDAVKSLLDHGSDVNATEPRGGQSALMFASGRKHPETVKLLVERKADVNAHSKKGFTPLMFAAEQGDLDAARILLSAGAKVNDPDRDGMNPLLVASAVGDKAMLALLLESGANSNSADNNGFTALHYAATRRNMLDSVKLLLARGANPNMRVLKNIPQRYTDSYWMSRIGSTSFLIAATAGNADIMRALAAGGADPNLTTDTGTTPLIMAAGLGVRPGAFGYRSEEQYKNSIECLKVAVELGADVNAVGESGWTALHGAAYSGGDSIIQFLVEHGANMEIMDQYGQTPLSIAQAVLTTGVNKNGQVRPARIFQSTVDLLLKLGAKPIDASGVQRMGSIAVNPNLK